MKHLFFVIFLTVPVVSGFAQGKVIFRDSEKNPMADTVKFIHDINEAGLPTSYEIEGYISNVSNQAVSIHIKRVIEKFMANSEEQICWGGSCTNPQYFRNLVFETNSSNLPANFDVLLADTGVFHFSHNSIIGTTQLKYYLMNGDNIEDSLVAVYTLTGPKVTLTFNVSLAELDGFNPTSKVYVQGDFGEKVRLTSWDSSTYWVSVPVDLNKSYTYKYIAGANTETIEHAVTVANIDVSTNDQFNVTAVNDHKIIGLMSMPSPNPANDFTQVKYNFTDISKGSIVILNVIGQKVFETNLSQKSGTLNISVERLPKGIYFINLQKDNNILSSYKLIKQ